MLDTGAATGNVTFVLQQSGTVTVQVKDANGNPVVVSVPDCTQRSVMRKTKGDNAVICHYFPSMVSEAIADARRTLGDA